MKKAIVTGANGFVGSHVVNELVKNNIEVLAIDLPDCSGNIPQSEKVTFCGMDIFTLAENADKIKKDYYDTFYHFAWLGSAGEKRTDCDLQMKNALCTVDCVKTAKALGCEKFVCAGSIMEKEAVAAVNAQGNRPGMGYIYGMGKLIAHCMSKSVAAQQGIDLVWAIITNAYGPGELSPRFVNTTIRKIINNESLQFTAATQNYDFIYIDDIAKAFYLLGEKGKPFNEYVLGSGNARPLREFIEEMTGALCPDVKPVFGDVPFTGVNMPLEVFSTQAIEQDCGFHTQVSFAEGTMRTMKSIVEKSCGGG